MSWLNKLERRLEPIAITNITLYIVIGQAFVYLTNMLGLLDARMFMLVPYLVQHGEVWRLLTFVFDPPAQSWLWIAFAFYMLYLFGSALENYWGATRYNLFLLSGYVLTVAVAFIHPLYPANNQFIGLSIFLAFAYVNPEFELLIFFVLPVKVKWLALISWAFQAYAFVTNGWPTRLTILAAVGNFLLFFGRDLLFSARSNGRRMNTRARQFREEAVEKGPRHRCHVCGKTDLTNPEMDFRYCSKCAGAQCYCPEHIRDHVHVLVETEEQK
jgi:hypothetical protein